MVSRFVERETLGAYVLLEKIGAGGMGCVYRAEHRHLKKIVALKVLAPALLRSAPAIWHFSRRHVSWVSRLIRNGTLTARNRKTARGFIRRP